MPGQGRQCRERHPQCKWNHTAPERAQESLASAVPPVTGPPSLTGPLNPPHSGSPLPPVLAPARQITGQLPCLLGFYFSISDTHRTQLNLQREGVRKKA